MPELGGWRGLAASNIAWEPADDDAVSAVLRRAGFAGVEIAPTKWRTDPVNAAPDDIAVYRRQWQDRGLEIVAMQALLFGRPELQLFADAASRTALVDYLRRIIDLASGLGARALVFGSPKNRLRGPMPLADAQAMATEVFRTIGIHAAERGTVLCLEANPPAYGCDFLTTTAEAAALCRAIDNPGIALNGDLGTIMLAGDEPATALGQARDVLTHFHASEAHLAELGSMAEHRAAAETLQSIGYRGWISVEMRAAGDGRNVEAVERAVRLTAGAYARPL